MFKKTAILSLSAAFCFASVYAQKPKPTKNVKAAKQVAAPAKKATEPTVKFDQTRLIEKVTRNGNELVIPYEKYVLNNGLTLVIHEDHSDPIVHVDVTYHVGSAREEIGKSGFAHFFEHMMFQGSDHVADEEHFKIVSESGGTLNGTTNRDRTNYFETLPSNQLETGLWLEADRMGFLLDAVTQKKFEVQRATVKNERGQNYDNRPYGLTGEYAAKTLYPYGHPYSWLTIGYIEDLNRVNVQDLKNFFLRWYGPNNAVLTVGGDVKPVEVIKLVEKYFGSIPRGPEVKNMSLPAPVIEQDRYVSYEDNVRFPMMQMTFPTVPQYNGDEAALDCLAEILGGGQNSIFYQRFVKKQEALQASVYHPTYELAGEFTITMLPFPGKNLAEMEKMVRVALEEFEKRGISDDDLKRFKAGYEVQAIEGMASVSGKVSQLAAYQTYTNNPNYMKVEMAKRMNLTKEEVMRVYNKYVKGKKATITSVVPKGKKDLIAAPDNYQADASKYATPVDEYKGLVYNKAKDNFDRSKRPASGANPVITVPDYWNDKFANGIRVIGTYTDELPMVSMLISVKGGHRAEAKTPEKAGVAQLVAGMMEEATEKYEAEDIANELEKLGSSISVSADNNEINIEISTLTKNLDATLKLAEERILRPRFAQEDFDRLKKQQMEGIANQNNQPVAIANKVFNRLLYGEGNIMAVPASGTLKTVENINLDDVKAYYKENFAPNLMSIVVVGSVTGETIMPKLEFLGRWQAPRVKRTQQQPTPQIDKTRIFLVDKEKAPQSEIRIGYMGLRFDATGRYYRAKLMNFILGGAFNSRINLNLREDKGYTYGARSGFSGTDAPGPFTASAGVKGNVTDSSIIEFMKEIKLYVEKGITDEELEFTKKSLGQSEALKYETQIQKAYFLNTIMTYGLDKNFTQKQNEILAKMTKTEIHNLARLMLPTDKMHIVVVGDKASLQDKLAKLGYEVVELDKDGNPVAGSAYKLSIAPPPPTPRDPKAPREAKVADEILEK